MRDTVMYTSAPVAIQAILVGGPESIPETSRLQTVSPLDEKIKLPHYGGYEHFERVDWCDKHPSARQLTYRWVMRTKIAE
jgi:hypothetical protein